jgi:hypothetical protein
MRRTFSAIVCSVLIGTTAGFLTGTSVSRVSVPSGPDSGASDTVLFSAVPSLTMVASCAKRAALGLNVLASITSVRMLGQPIVSCFESVDVDSVLVPRNGDAKSNIDRILIQLQNGGWAVERPGESMTKDAVGISLSPLGQHRVPFEPPSFESRFGYRSHSFDQYNASGISVQIRIDG